jgi:hypothetical protein
VATYKVIQDIEAEDHILGPLTLRQFIYGLVAALFFYISFIVISKSVIFLLPIFLLPALIAAFFAFPFRKDQPTEIWALAKIRFLFKSRVRLWNQSGIKELVTVTAPKKVEKHLTNGLSQNEVRSRLEILADTIDSRGWAVKNISANTIAPTLLNRQTSDRIIDLSSIPKPVPDYEINPTEDILDETQNPLAQHLSQMIDQSSAEHRQQLINNLNNIASSTSPINNPILNDRAEENAIASRLKQQEVNRSLSTANLHTLPTPTKRVKATTNPAIVTPPTKPVQATTNPAIINQYLSRDNNLSVSTLQSEARKAMEDEVVIELHR